MDLPEICIVGAGIIGLSLALELHSRGVRVTVLDQGEPLAEASTAAAGMLAVRDPDNPPALRPLSELSRSLYPNYLAHLFDLSVIAVAFQTGTTLQEIPAHMLDSAHELTTVSEETLSLLLPQLKAGNRRFTLLDEQSLDPRELARALLAAVRSTTIELHPQTPVRFVRSNTGTIEVHTGTKVFSPSSVVDCTGAWGLTQLPLRHVRAIPRKGQMLAVTLPATLPLNLVVRTPDIYIVPRTTGTSAGRAIIGATVEDAGFDKKVYPGEIARLRARAADLLPDLANAVEAETWAGLRPGSSDGLPLLGQVAKNHFIASGHYRNGILLAPATALVMAQIILGEQPEVDLDTFSPLRIL